LGGDEVKVLFISTTNPNNKLASWLYIRGIAEAFFEIAKTKFWFSDFDCEGEPTSVQDFKCVKVFERKKSRVILSRIKSLFGNIYSRGAYEKKRVLSLRKTIIEFQPNIVVYTSLSASSYFFDVKKIKPETTSVLIQHNVEYLVADGLSKFGRNALQRAYYLVQKRSVKKFERKMMELSDYVISISDSDRNYFRKTYCINADKIFTIRPLIEYKVNLYGRENKNNNKTISFVSSFDWYPNIRGAEFFIKSVLPTLVERFPTLKLYLVGRDPVRSIYRLKDEFPGNIVVTGSVENIYDYYKISDCIVIPVFLGPGIKLKVLEAMASGVPTVMTSYVAKDYDLLDKGFCIADTPDEFVEHISKILTDSEFANELSKRQVQWYENYLISEKEHAEEVIKTILFSHSKNENN